MGLSLTALLSCLNSSFFLLCLCVYHQCVDPCVMPCPWRELQPSRRSARHESAVAKPKPTMTLLWPRYGKVSGAETVVFFYLYTFAVALAGSSSLLVFGWTSSRMLKSIVLRIPGRIHLKVYPQAHMAVLFSAQIMIPMSFVPGYGHVHVCLNWLL